jgi:hypothetical protein
MGSLYQDLKTLELFIGPVIETGKGLWTSSMDYYLMENLTSKQVSKNLKGVSIDVVMTIQIVWCIDGIHGHCIATKVIGSVIE